MEDFIPLLIIIAISIIGALGRKKKRQENENISMPHQHEQRDDDVFGWLERLNIDKDDSYFTEEKPLMEVEKNDFEPAKSKVVDLEAKNEQVPNIFSKYSGFISPEEREEMVSKEGISIVKKNTIVEGDLTQKTSEGAETVEKKPKLEFDIKKAVIFNEILNRKYI